MEPHGWGQVSQQRYDAVGAQGALPAPRCARGAKAYEWPSQVQGAAKPMQVVSQQGGE